MTTAENKSSKRWRNVITSVDDWFIIAGILLNGFSLVMSFVYGHTIAGLILLICEILLIGIYLMKMI